MLVEIQFFNDTTRELGVHAGSNNAYLHGDIGGWPVNPIPPQTCVYFQVDTQANGGQMPFVKVWDGMVLVR